MHGIFIIPNLLIGIAAAALALPGAALALQSLSEWRDKRRFPPPGRLVPAANGVAHVHCSGSSGPAVVLEAGIAASSLSWARVEPALAEFAQVFSYDRSGLGWSPVARNRVDADSLVNTLHEVTRAAGVPRPFILAAHSFGGLLARIYAARHPEDLAGVVLVDPALVSEWACPDERRRGMLERGVRFSRRGARLARFGVVRLGLHLAKTGARDTAKRIARVSSSPGGQKTVERLIGEIRKMPASVLPAVQAHWSGSAAFEAMAQHLEALPGTCAAARDAAFPPDMPLTVISGGHLPPEQHEEQDAVARLSRKGRHIIAANSGHWVHLDQPELVVEAVREMAMASRAPGAHS